MISMMFSLATPHVFGNEGQHAEMSRTLDGDGGGHGGGADILRIRFCRATNCAQLVVL
jgi:hypothetical protein